MTLPSAGEIPTGRSNELEVALREGVDKTAKALADKAAAEAKPDPEVTMESTLAALRAIVGKPDPETPPDPAKARPEPGKEGEGGEPPTPDAARAAQVDELMKDLEDESQSVQKAVRKALEKGMQASDTLEALLDQRDQILAEERLVQNVDELAKRYPGLTPDDVVKTLEHMNTKLSPALAEELSFEEVALRALGAEILEQRKVKLAPLAKEPAPSNSAAPGPGVRRPAVAEIIGDATPGSPGDGKPFEAGYGNDFNDLARHIVQKHGSDLVKAR
jgi:hypothetical protein